MKMVMRAGGEHLVEHVDVGGEPRHQAADRVAVEEAHRQALQVREQLRRAGRRGCAARPASSGSTAGRRSANSPIIGRGEEAADARQPVGVAVRRRSGRSRSSAGRAAPACSAEISGRQQRRASQNDAAVRADVRPQPAHQRARRRPCRAPPRRGCCPRRAACARPCRRRAAASQRLQLLARGAAAGRGRRRARRARAAAAWSPTLDDAAVVEHQDEVGVLHGRDAVRDQDAGALAHDARAAPRRMRCSVSRVDARQRVVEDQDRRRRRAARAPASRAASGRPRA